MWIEIIVLPQVIVQLVLHQLRQNLSSRVSWESPLPNVTQTGRKMSTAQAKFRPSQMEYSFYGRSPQETRNYSVALSEDPYTKYHPHRLRNMQRISRNSPKPFSKVWLSLDPSAQCTCRNQFKIRQIVQSLISGHLEMDGRTILHTEHLII